MWDHSPCDSAGGFAERVIGVVQRIANRPDDRLPLARVGSAR